MFQTVLVGADSSLTASRAVSTAVELVKAVGGTLHVVTAYKPPDQPRMDKLPDEFFDRMTDPADLLLEKCEPASPRRSGGEVLPRRR